MILPRVKFDIGTKANRLIKDMHEKDQAIIQIKFKKFVLGIVQKILERSPLKKTLVRNLTWMHPDVIAKGEGNF